MEFLTAVNVAAVVAVVSLFAGKVVKKVADHLVATITKQIGCLLDYLVAPIGREVSYLFNYKSKCDKLKAQLSNLDDARARVQERIDEAKKNANDIKADVESWLTEVSGKISAEAARQLVEDEEKAKQRCLFGLCPDFMSRYKFSKKAVKEANSIAKLLEREGRFDGVSCRPAPEGMPPVKGYEEFESRRGAFDGVMEALKDANLSLIGVYGMGGVGKTTLVKQVASQAKDEKLFGYVVMAALTQTPNMLNLQKEIAEKLGMKFDVDSMDERGALLRKRLREEKSNVLIILDDIWSPLNLDELGVPAGDQHMGCKILMTSRELNVLSLMDSQKSIPVDTLKDDEAWKLFKKKAGDTVEISKVLPIATEVAKKCAGLPIAIVTIGSALKGKNLAQWKNTLRELKRPSISNFNGIPGEVYKSIELSYGFLKTQELRSTFLLCSVMGHDAVVEDLPRYCKGLDLIHGVETIEEARDKVSTLIDELKASCLLLDGSTSGHVDIHDVVRNVAISIASRDNHWLALGRDDVSQDWSNEETMKNYNLISLWQYAKVSELIELGHELKCPQLTFFFMGSNWKSLKIPNNFFMGMPKVKVLGFARMRFSSLPSSIEFLTALRTLSLRGCVLKDMAIIGELKNLEILDLSYNNAVETLSREIGKLSRLKLLDLSRCKYLKVIPPNVLSRLSRLEELYLYGSFDSWEVVDDEGCESPVGSNASLVELKNLSHLTILEVRVGNVKAMPKDTTFFGKLERFKISIGKKKLCYFGYEQETTTTMMLKLSDRGDKMFDDRLLTKVENLCLDGVNDVTNLERISFGKFNVKSFSQLRVLQISKCERLKNLFSFSIAKELHQLQEIDVSDCKNITELIVEQEEEDTLTFDKLNSLKLRSLPKLIRLFDHKVAFPMLEKLEISWTENLERLWPNQLADEESFSRLTQLCLYGCDKLLNVFPLSTSRRLQRLKELTISGCKLVEEIFEPPLSIQAQAENIITFEFPQLAELELFSLPNLKSFYHQPCTIKLPSLKMELTELTVYGCDKVQIRFATSFFAKTREKRQLPLFCLNDGMEETWPDPQLLASQYFYSVEVVRIESFPKEMDIFSSKLFQFLISLPNLQHLEINNTYFKQILEDVQKKEGVFQNLKNLQVRWCPNLKDNLVPSSLSFQNLVALEVESCGGIIKLVTHSTAKSLVQLQEMRIKSCFEIEKIIEDSKDDDEDGEMKDELLHFPRLKLLELSDLPNLESFCSSGNYTFQFPSLQTVIVNHCPKMKTFSQDDLETPMLRKVKLSTWQDEESWSGTLNNTIQEMFKEKKSKEDEHNPSTLEQLIVTWNSEMKEIWHNYGPLQLLSSKYFCTIKVVIILFFTEIIPSASHQLFQFLISLPNLRSLDIIDSHFKEIFQSPSSALEGQVQELRLESSISVDQPCHDGVSQISSFRLLTTLKVSSCHKLKYLFPSSMVKSFVQLKTLDVEHCYEMEQLIILSEGLGDEEWNNIMVFPQLDCLNLRKLPNLKRFCSGNRIELPSLRKLEIDNCSDLDLGTSKEVQKNNISTEKCQDDVLQYLFNDGLSLTNLEELSMGWTDGMKEMCPQQLASQYFCSLKVVRFLSFPWEMKIFPSQLFQFLISLPNLQGLEIRNANFQEIFQSLLFALEGVQLKDALFQNLVTLVVFSCHGIKKLVTHSTAKSLVQLQEMRIRCCDEIEEIIVGSRDDDNEDGEMKDELLHFPRLKLLELCDLPKLESFCSLGNYTFQFPSLQIVIVNNCPKMKIFSQGDPETPMLQKVSEYENDNEGRWSVNLNSTIQEMFKEKESLGDDEDSEVSD